MASASDRALAKRAREAGISTEYRDWEGRPTEVPAETLRAILSVLEDPAPAGPGGPADAAGPAGPGGSADATGPGGLEGPGRPADAAGPAGPADTTDLAPAAAGQAEAGAPGAALTAPPLAMPAQRQWGFTVQLYSVRSRESWGHGDLHDLAELARWSAAELGAGFILVNPLHAAEPLPPVSASPYLPMTRLFTSPLYLRVEDIPEYAQLQPAAKDAVARLAAPLLAASQTPALIDRDAVWTAKRSALKLIAEVPPTAARQAEFDKFRAERGVALVRWSAWCALAERHGPDWREWPPDLADPLTAVRRMVADQDLRAQAEFHAWLQWQADQQLANAQAAATAAGMAHGIIHDLAVGVHPGGADAWAQQGLLVQGFSVGAPPDAFNQVGQDWSQPPWHPRRLADADYQPMAELFGAVLRHGGGVRVDHVMGLMRLWWLKAGERPGRGAYVSYDYEAAVAALTGAAAAAGAVAIGEDLGTVEPWITEYLASRGILGTMMLWFARDDDSAPLPPQRWRRACMATVGTHDVPPVSGFVTGEQVSVRARLGLLATSEERERAEAAQTVSRWQAALVEEGLLASGQQPTEAEFTVALYGYLSRTPALLLGVSLADAVGDVRTQNIPGTAAEYPNWQIPLCGPDGRSVLIEQLPGLPLVRQVSAAVRGT